MTPKDLLKNVLRYHRGHLAALTRPLEDPAVANDNSATERPLQVIGKLRHACFLAGRPIGTKRMARLLGIMLTRRRLGVDPVGYRTRHFERTGTTQARNGPGLSQVTPAAYLAERQRRSLARAAAWPPGVGAGAPWHG